jgi:hypothetical protein
MDAIKQTFPHLKNINTPHNYQVDQNVTGVVIRSANDDNVHKVTLILFRPLNMEYGPPRLRTSSSWNNCGTEIKH